jgi:hypothetical protein
MAPNSRILFAASASSEKTAKRQPVYSWGGPHAIGEGANIDLLTEAWLLGLGLEFFDLLA